MQIKIDDLRGGEVVALLEEHLSDMYATSPPESVHALNPAELRSDNITFFSAWIDGALAGCIAIKMLSAAEAEIKSMRTSHGFRRRGVAESLLQHLLAYAKDKGYSRLSLETGTQDYFQPARALYKKHGFTDCEPFADYTLDPNSHFMTRRL